MTIIINNNAYNNINNKILITIILITIINDSNNEFINLISDFSQ